MSSLFFFPVSFLYFEMGSRISQDGLELYVEPTVSLNVCSSCLCHLSRSGIISVHHHMLLLWFRQMMKGVAVGEGARKRRGWGRSGCV